MFRQQKVWSLAVVAVAVVLMAAASVQATWKLTANLERLLQRGQL